MKVAASLAVAMLVLLTTGAVPAGVDLVAFSGFDAAPQQARLVQGLDWQTLVAISSVGGFRGVEVQPICDDVAVAAAEAGAQYYILGKLSANGRSVRVALYATTNAHPLRTSNVPVTPDGKLLQSGIAGLFDGSRWSTVVAERGSC